MRWPILVSEQTGFIKAGEGRLLAALKLGMPKVLVSYQEFEDAETEFAFGVSDNAIALWADLDLPGIVQDLDELEAELEDTDWLGIRSFDLGNLGPDEKGEGEVAGLEGDAPKKEMEGSTKIIIHLTEEQHAQIMPRIQKCCEAAEIYDLSSLFMAAIDSLERDLSP